MRQLIACTFFLVPSVLDCGGCLVGASKLWSTPCTNFGGEGSFKMMLANEDISTEEGESEVGGQALNSRNTA